MRLFYLLFHTLAAVSPSTVEEIYLSELTLSDRDAFGTLHRLMESFRMKSLYQYVGKSYWDGAFRHLLAKK